MFDILNQKLAYRPARESPGLLPFNAVPPQGLVEREREFYAKTVGKNARIDSPAARDFVELSTRKA